MKAKSIKGKTPEEIQSALQQSMADGYKPTLAIVFTSIKQDRKAVCEVLQQTGIDIFGATSSGEFIDGYQSEGATVILLMDVNKNNYTILLEDIGDRSLDEAATKMTKDALEKFSNPAFILCSTSLTDDGKILEGETLIRSIENAAGAKANIFGGMAGDDISFTGTYVFTKEQSTRYGVAALVLNEDKISLQGMAISGWKPLGITRTVTKSEDNLLYTIDDKPALEMYLRFLGSDMSSAEDQITFFESLGNHYPFQIERAGREPMMCNPIGYDREKGALICESNVQQGAKFRFSTPPDFDIMDTIVKNAEEMKGDKNADALLIFSCAGRLAALGPMAHQENEGLYNVWKVPMAGFYTYGEYGRAVNGKHEFHSTTNSWVALKEK
ncbi:MAG: FIST N-terminal domain-containing protein [Saprospiraceae bacterium]|nr:FIST N-terminal domain-containing protein [Saprospiraceae bacterium]